MPGRDIIVVGASAGGVEALSQLAAGLPKDLPAAVFIVLHVPAQGTSVLPQILSRVGPLPATHPQDGEPIHVGHIYVAPPDRHLLVRDGHVRLTRGPRENSNRPAIDPLFRTAARDHGRHVIGVVLTGVLDDGTAGLAAVKQRGGVAVVQDPADALYAGMPQSALANVAVDYCLPVTAMPQTLARLAAEPLPPGADPSPVSPEMDIEARIAELEMDALQAPDPDRPGTPSGFSCPECGGSLWELHEGDLIRFRCRVGHAWSADSLLAEQSVALEAALWAALRALEEKANLARRLAERIRSRGDGKRTAEHFERQVEECEQHAALLRQTLLQRQASPPGGSAAEAS